MAHGTGASIRSADVEPKPRTAPWLATAAVMIAALMPPAAEAATPLPLGRVASAPAELAVSFEEAAVVASELSPGGEAVFFSVAREPQGYFTRIVRRSGVEGVDALGEARFEVSGGEVPLKSVWVVADVSTGAVSVAAPEGFTLRDVPFPGRAFEVGPPGRVNRLRHTAEAIDFLLVRPGVGAWSLVAWDLSPRDRDGRDDDRVLTALEDLEPVDVLTEPPPERFLAGDVLVAIDPRQLTFYATRLLATPQAKGGRR
jgi:hypothetical protein